MRYEISKPSSIIYQACFCFALPWFASKEQWNFPNQSERQWWRETAVLNPRTQFCSCKKKQEWIIALFDGAFWKDDEIFFIAMFQLWIWGLHTTDPYLFNLENWWLQVTNKLHMQVKMSIRENEWMKYLNKLNIMIFLQMWKFQPSFQ